jgi:predicted MPP superfamily phosphohydrolase
MDRAPESSIASAPPGPLRARVRVEDPGAWLQLGLPRSVQWTHVTLPIPGLPPALEGLRLLHLSDLHLRPRWAAGYDRLIERLAADPPDLILFTGDFVEDKRDYRPALPVAQRLVSSLRSRHGTYAIVGNHDGDLLAAQLPSLNATNVEGRHLTLAGGIELLGFPGVERADLDHGFIQSIPPKPPGHVRIALCHYPDLFDTVAAARPDLYLCGHSHGGQVCLPGGVPIITHDRSPGRFVRGIHRRGDCWYIANRGFGAGKLLLRVFCPAEVIQITLEPAPGEQMT